MSRCFLILLLTVSAAFAAEDTSLAQVKKRKTLTVGIESIFTGLNVLTNRDPKTGKYSGMEIELAEHIARSLGVTLEIVPVKWDRIFEAVRNGAADIGLQQIFIPAPGEVPATDAYSIPYLETGLGIARRRGDTAVRTDTLKSKIAGAFDDPVALRVLRLHGVARIRSFDNELSLFESILHGSVDYLAADKVSVLGFAKRNPTKVELVPGLFPGSEGKYGVLTKAKATSLLQAVNLAIAAWLAEPGIKERIARLNLK